MPQPVARVSCPCALAPDHLLAPCPLVRCPRHYPSENILVHEFAHTVMNREWGMHREEGSEGTALACGPRVVRLCMTGLSCALRPCSGHD